MKKENQSIQIEFADPSEDAAAIKECLNYLREEAERTGLSFAAHIISVAAQAVADSIARKNDFASDAETEVKAPLRAGRLH